MAICAVTAANASMSAHWIFAETIFAVVICAVAIAAMEAYSSSVVMLPATSSCILAVTAVKAFTFSTSMSASAICARVMLAS